MPVPLSGRAARLARPGRLRWADLRVRLLSALVLGPLGLAALWAGGAVWQGLIGLLCCGLGLEWARIAGRISGSRGWRWGFAGGLAIAAAGVALIWLRAGSVAGRDGVLFVVLVVWASDIGAYLAGRLVGGPRLAPAISPGKTWAGALGGLAAALLAGSAVAQATRGAPPWAGPGSALLLGLAAQVGDLAESAAKRRAGVKDSGGLIPGHGGLLDRLDGMLAATLIAALLAMLTEQGVVFWR